MTSKGLIVLTLSLIALVTCNRAPDTVQVGDEEVPVERLRATVVALCEFDGLVDAGQNADAKRSFYDEVHDGLHLLAAAVAEQNRAGTTRLLVAKEAVEAKLEGSPKPERDTELVEASSKLVTESQSSLELLSIDKAEC